MRSDADFGVGAVADLVVDFASVLGLEHFTRVGNDSGGGIAQLVLSRYPERVERLVLTSCDAFEAFPPMGFGPMVRASV